MPIGTPTSIGSTTASASGPTAVITVTASVAIGQKVIVVVGCDGLNPANPTCADTQSNPYVLDATSKGTAAANLFIFSSQIATGLTTSDTITVTYDVNRGHRDGFACQVSGLRTSGAFDKSAFSNDTSINWTSTSTPTTTQANELVIGGCLNNGSGTPTSTPGTGYTELFDATDGGACELTVVYQIVSATGAYAANGTWSTGTPANAEIVGTYIGVDQGGGLVLGDPFLWHELDGPGDPIGGPYAFMENRVFSTAGQTFLQNLLASDLVTTATIVKQVGKILSATSNTTASFVKQVGKILSATSTTTSSLVKQVGKTLSTTVTTTATLAAMKVVLLTLSATVTTTATMIKQAGKILSATVTTTATLVKQVGKILSATSTTTATMATLKVILRTLTANTVTTTATITRQINKLLTVTVATTASLIKQINKPLTRTVTTTATLATLKVVLRTLTANTVSTTASFRIQVGKLLAATSSITATMDLVSSAIVAFFQKEFDRILGHPHVTDQPDDADWQSGPHGNLSSDPKQKGFD